MDLQGITFLKDFKDDQKLKEIIPEENNLPNIKPIWQRYEWMILIIIIFAGGLLNGGRFSNSPKTETFVEVVFLIPVLLWIVLIWKRSIRAGATLFEKCIQFLRIFLAIILFFSLATLSQGNFGDNEVVFPVLIISSVISALGLLLLTIYIKILGKGNIEKEC